MKNLKICSRLFLFALGINAYAISPKPLSSTDSVKVIQPPPRESTDSVKTRTSAPDSICKTQNRFSLVVHGGYGWTEPRALDFLKATLTEGHRRLEAGETSLNVVQRLVQNLEDSGLFNAGKGAVFNIDKDFELDAALMNGEDLRVGSVSGVQHVKNPILLAREILETGKIVMLTGQGATRFAREKNLPMVEKNYFKTAFVPQSEIPGQPHPIHYGTVGAVAWDRCGHLAAATSTGGLENKPVGRVGDSPIIGAGTYANDKTCGVSATGFGEFFIRANAASTVSALIEYRKLPIMEAVNGALKKVKDLGGNGGIIAIDRNGKVALSTTADFMISGSTTDSEPLQIFQPVK